MSNFSIFIEQELERSQNNYEIIEEQIKILFRAIAKTESIEESEIIFRNIEEIQFILAKAAFKEGKILSPFLRKFVHDFDRIDDQRVKSFQYKQIKEAE
jgi:hypothetical protein